MMPIKVCSMHNKSSRTCNVCVRDGWGGGGLHGVKSFLTSQVWCQTDTGVTIIVRQRRNSAWNIVLRFIMRTISRLLMVFPKKFANRQFLSPVVPWSIFNI